MQKVAQEAELQAIVKNLLNELSTLNVPHNRREEFRKKLEECKQKLSEGETDLQNEVEALERELTLTVIEKAETEIPKSDREHAAYLALEDIKKDYSEKRISAHKARHEVKEILRHHF